MKTLELTSEADEDIIRSYVFGFQSFGLAQAEKYASELERCLQLIAEFPELARERSEFSPPVRIHHHAHHTIVYRIEAERVLIIRVLRDEVDLTRLF